MIWHTELRPLSSALAVVLGLIWVCACGGAPSDGAGEASATRGKAFGSAGKAAPQFTLDDLEGGQVRLSDSAGKVRLIDFWATWCVPCVEEIPMFKELHATYADKGLEILAISESEEPADLVRKFVRDHEVNYKNLIGTAEIAEQYGVLGLPSTFIIDGQGTIIESYMGPKPKKVLTEKIRELLAEPPA